ncbi:ATP-binding protein [bacterium]|nr:ATP-binding protein [bacterium]
MKIGLCGTMSVGKTTLVNELKKLGQFKDYEFATERSEYLMNLGIPLNTDSTLNGQTIFLAERVAELMKENVITDRTVLDVIAFTNLAKSIDFKDKEYFEDYARVFVGQYDYIFYISPEGTVMEDNGVRETDLEYRDLIDQAIIKAMNTYGHRCKNVHMLKGSTVDRIEQMLGVIQF